MPVMVLAVLLTGAFSPNSQSQGPTTEPGDLPVRWTPATPDCTGVPPFVAHEYNPTFIIIRQSGCTNFEKPFLYLVLGSAQAMLVDTGANGADVASFVDDLLHRQPQRQQLPILPLLVVHSHGHGDHTAGDQTLRKKAGVTFVEATPEALAAFFKISQWPRDIVQHDLGDRVIDIIPIPGHQPASIAIYDRRTEILLTGDTLYPGRLYVRDADAFRASVDRLVEFTATREVAHILGAHIENRRTPFLDYPQGTTYQPDEHNLELGRAHLLELQNGLRQMTAQVQRRAFRDFTIWPVSR